MIRRQGQRECCTEWMVGWGSVCMHIAGKFTTTWDSFSWPSFIRHSLHPTHYSLSNETTTKSISNCWQRFSSDNLLPPPPVYHHHPPGGNNSENYHPKGRVFFLIEMAWQRDWQCTRYITLLALPRIPPAHVFPFAGSFIRIRICSFLIELFNRGSSSTIPNDKTRRRWTDNVDHHRRLFAWKTFVLSSPPIPVQLELSRERFLSSYSVLFPFLSDSPLNPS